MSASSVDTLHLLQYKEPSCAQVDTLGDIFTNARAISNTSNFQFGTQAKRTIPLDHPYAPVSPKIH